MSVTPVASHTRTPPGTAGSSPLQDRDHTRQRRTVDRPVDDHPALARQHDLNPARRRRTLHRDVLGCWSHRPRTGLGVRCRPNDNRHVPARPGGALRRAKQPPLPEDLIGVQVAALGDHRHRNARLMGLRHDLPFLRLAPPPATVTNLPAALRARLLLGNLRWPRKIGQVAKVCRLDL